MSNVRPFPAYEDYDDVEPRRASLEDVAEQWLIAAILDSPRGYAEAAEVIDRDDLTNHGYRLIWDTAGQLIADQREAHALAVRFEIERMGRLAEIGRGRLIDDLAAVAIPAGMAGKLAEKVAKLARAWRASAFAVRYRQAATESAADEVDEVLAKLLAEHVEAEQLKADRATGPGGGPAHILAAALDWGPFFSTDYTNVQLLPGKLLAPGQQIAVVGDGKAGKSLFLQEWVWRATTGQSALGDAPQAPLRVLYIDAENGHPELQQRFRSFGAGPQTMGTLTYLSFPPIRPLDTPGGGQDLLAVAKAVGAQVVVIDTVSRFIGGEENSADTWLALYRNTLMPLKAAGIASIRLDHFGKDGERGARGSSAKTQDVDHVWELRAQGGGILSLKRTHSRTGVGPDEFTLIRHSRKIGDDWVAGATRHAVMTHQDRAVLIEGTTEWLVDQLDRAGVDPAWGSPKVLGWCRENGVRTAKAKVEEAVRVRKSRPSPDLPPHLPYSPVTQTPPDARGVQDKLPGQTSPGEVGGMSGDVPATPPSPRLPPKEGGGGSAPGENKPICDICGHPLAPDWAARGYTTHLLCQPDRDEP
ncbi:AAA family ATPase [Kitasatospora purpeofusca]|uniref:AAA family ATPase n=1 Tax=Kitasatospora purpeofusca TaxID=67352 RepID=UPI0036494ED5